MGHMFDEAGSDALVQRFIDQELTAEERVRFVSRLGRDDALRQRTIELETLLIDAGRLPRPIVPDGFAASVMERLPAARPSRRLRDLLWMPRTLEWNFVGAIVPVAVAVLIVAAAVMRHTPTTEQLAPLSASVASITPVRLAIMQPGPRMVQVAGDFNGWNPAQTSLEQTTDGAWTVTIPLKPGRYAYMFVVDGRRWIADPFAAEQKDDGFGARNAVLDVPSAPIARPTL